MIKQKGVFVAKIFKGKEIEFLFAQMKVFFDDVYCAKPKSSRNSSQEAFIVGKGFKYIGDNLLCAGKLLQPIAAQPIIEETKMKAEYQTTNQLIQFVQCGNLAQSDFNINQSDQGAKKPEPEKTESESAAANPSLADYLNLFNTIP